MKLCDLPDDILNDVLMEWSSPIWLQRLDCALYTSDNLEDLHHIAHIISKALHRMDCKFLDLALSRNVTLCSSFLWSSSKIWTMLQNKQFDNLESLSFNAEGICYGSLIILGLCKHLKSLEISSFCDKRPCKTVSTSIMCMLAHLTTLVFHDCTTGLVKLFIKHAENIKALHVFNFDSRLQGCKLDKLFIEQFVLTKKCLVDCSLLTLGNDAMTSRCTFTASMVCNLVSIRRVRFQNSLYLVKENALELINVWFRNELERFGAVFPNLCELNVQTLDGGHLLTIQACFRSLKSISLICCSKIVDEFRSFGRAISNTLIKLKVHFEEDITDNSINSIFANSNVFHNLTNLTVLRAKELTSETIGLMWSKERPMMKLKVIQLLPQRKISLRTRKV